jgi:hypothetical protein
MKARHLLVSLMCIAVAGTGCAGGGTGDTAAANGGNGGNAGDLRSEVDTSACKELPADLVNAVSAKLTNITLSHVFLVKQSDKLFYVSGRMEGTGQAGNDIATFALTSENPASARIYAVGPNASNYSDFEDAPADVATLTDTAAVTSNSCAKTP